MDLEVTCTCGHRIVVSEFALGMTNRCPGCKEPLTVTLKNSRPLDQDGPRPEAPEPAAAAAPMASPFDAAEPERTVRDPKKHCARCGRVFRGDWDRYRAPEGTVCHICRHQAVKPEEQSITGFIEPVESLKIDAASGAIPPVEPSTVVFEEEDVPWYKRISVDEEFMRKVAIAGAILILSLSVYYWVTQGFVVPSREALHGGGEPSEQAAESTPAVEATPMHARALIAISIFTKFAGCYAGLILYLTWVNRMPNESLFANLLVILPVALGLTVVLYIPFLGYLVAILLVYKLYDFEWIDLIRLPLSLFVGNVFGYFAYVFLAGLLGMTLRA